MNIGVELDDVISSALSNYTALTEVASTKVLEGSKEALDKIKAMGHVIVIYTSRDASLGPDTEIWLQRNKIPYDKIIFNKPVLDINIDKKCCKFENWDSFLEKYKYHLRNN